MTNDTNDVVFPEHCSISYATLFEENPMMLVIINPNGVILAINKFVTAHLGYSSDELIGNSILDIFFEEDREAVASQIKDSLDNGQKISHWELRKIRKDGSLIWVREFARPLTSTTGAQCILVCCEDITAQKEAEEISERLSMAVDHAGLGTWYSDLVTGKNVWSRNLFELLGYDQRSVKPSIEAWQPRVHPDDISLVLADIEEARSKRKLTRTEYRIIKANSGEIRWVNSYRRFLYDSRGNPTRLMGVFFDITERKKLEEDRENAIQEWERTFDSVPDLMAIIDRDCMIKRVNKSLADLLELTPQQCIGQVCYELLHGMDHPPEYCPHLKTLSDNLAHVTDVHEERFGRDFIVSTTPIVDAQGNNIGTLQLARDITDRKKAEEKIAELNKELEHKVAELEAIYNTAPIGIAICYDRQCATIKGNPVMADMLGMPPHPGMWIITPESAPGNYKFMRDGLELTPDELPMKIAISTGGKVRNATLDILRGDGRKIAIYGNAAPILDQEGKPQGVVGAFTDITELKKAENSIEELNRTLKKKVAELEYAFRELDAFSYSVSHDLNAPLRRIDSYYGMMLDQYSDTLDKKARSYLAKMKENVEKMKELIEALLVLSKVSRKKLHLSEIDMTAMVQNIFAEIRSDFPNRSISLHVKEMPHAEADKILVHQVVTNLLTNASKFTVDTDPSVIEVGGWADARENVYYVKDNGIGFDMKFADRIFNVFQRLHTTEEFEGTGIGLSIVQRAILRHGGRVWAEGKPGEGSAFYFTLPRKNVV